MPQQIPSLSRRSLLKIMGIGTAGLLVGCNSTPHASASDPPTGVSVPAGTAAPVAERWASSTNLNITLHSSAGPDQTLTRSGNDFKPSWSPDGTRLTFFRAEKYGSDF